MASNHMKQGVALMAIFMLVLARGDSNIGSPTKVEPTDTEDACAKTCAQSCAAVIIGFELCISQCMVACEKNPPPVGLSECIASCGFTQSIDDNNGDRVMHANKGDPCLEACKYT